MRFRLRFLWEQRSFNIAVNTIASALMKIVSLVCSLIIVPISIDYLTPEKYGIWIAMTSILFWISFFDIGLGNGMRNYMAEAYAKGDKQSAKSYFSTATIITTAIALSICAISVLLIYNLDLSAIFNTTEVSKESLADVLMVAIIFSLMLFVVKNIGMAYIAMQRYAINDLIIFIGMIVTVCAIYIMSKTTEGSLLKIVIVYTAIPVVFFLLAAIPLFKSHPELMPSLKSVNINDARKVVSKGMGFFLIQITSCLVIFGSSNIFISHYCGPEQVTIYNVAYKLFNILVTGYTILIAPLWSAYTDASVKQDYAWIKKTFHRSLYFWILSLLGGMLLLAISNWFFSKWVGDSIEVPFAVSCSMLLFVCFFNLNNCATYLINGLNKIKIQIITSITATALYLIIVLCFGFKLGIIGITLTMALAYVLMSVVHLYQCHLFVNQKAIGLWNM